MPSSNEQLSSMKVVILAGGFGTRISEETSFKPKPMVEIGGKPILWHIMKIYSHYGFNDFVICLGYKSEYVKDYFSRYFVYQSDVTYNYREQNKESIHGYSAEPWKITLAFTGHDTMTGGRVKRVAPYVGNEPFLLTYGDGLCDVNVSELVQFHLKHGKLATVTTVQPEGRFGALNISQGQRVEGFLEKPKGDGGWINGGFFVMQPEVFEYIRDDSTILEREPLEQLAVDGQLMAYEHNGFWQPMDTLRDKNELQKIWDTGSAPWKKW